MNLERPILRDLLKSVSRSFYLSLRILPENIRPAMGLGYLFCRAADTIADQDILAPARRRLALARFKALFEGFPLSIEKADLFHQTLAEETTVSPNAEGRLLRAFPDCVRLLSQLNKTDQARIQAVVLSVIKGMEMDLGHFGETAANVKAFESSRQLETYIGLIGGEPGRFWSDLLFHHVPSLRSVNRAPWVFHGIQLGKGLQMVNILRDLPNDLRRGRCYIPEERLTSARLRVQDLLDAASTPQFLPLYHALIDETIALLRHGVNYIHMIPRRHGTLRAAVWWPLIIGLKTLALLRLLPAPLGTVGARKVARREIYKAMAGSSVLIWSNRLIEKEFNYAATWASSKM